jgi:hypothetical protein
MLHAFNVRAWGVVMLASWRSSHGAILILLLMFLLGVGSTFANAAAGRFASCGTA